METKNKNAFIVMQNKILTGVLILALLVVTALFIATNKKTSAYENDVVAQQTPSVLTQVESSPSTTPESEVTISTKTEEVNTTETTNNTNSENTTDTAVSLDNSENKNDETPKVVVYDPLEVQAQASPVNGISPANVTFNANVAGGNEDNTYQWKILTSNTPHAFNNVVVTQSNEKTFSYQILRRGLFTADITVHSSNGMEANDAAAFSVGPQPQNPVNLQISSSENGLHLSWGINDPDNTDYWYSVHRAECVDGSACTQTVHWESYLARTKALSYTDKSSLENGKWYKYYVNSYLNGWELGLYTHAVVLYGTENTPIAPSLPSSENEETVPTGSGSQL